MKFVSTFLLVFFVATRSSASFAAEDDLLLIANTLGNTSIVAYNLADKSLSEYATVVDGLVSPDHMVLHDDDLYVSIGDTVENSAIAKLTTPGGAIDTTFATGGGLKRPYGFAFYNGTIFVASFMTDQILEYDAVSGDYLGVFAQGNATEEGLCNGPNQIAIHEGLMYLTTQGSFIDDEGALNYAFSSQTVVYDLATGQGEVFLPPPMVLEGSLGFVSMLGIHIGCDEESALPDACTVYTTDFAGGLRAYNLETKELLYAAATKCFSVSR